MDHWRAEHSSHELWVLSQTDCRLSGLCQSTCPGSLDQGNLSHHLQNAKTVYFLFGRTWLVLCKTSWYSKGIQTRPDMRFFKSVTKELHSGAMGWVKNLRDTQSKNNNRDVTLRCILKHCKKCEFCPCPFVKHCTNRECSQCFAIRLWAVLSSTFWRCQQYHKALAVSLLFSSPQQESRFSRFHEIFLQISFLLFDFRPFEIQFHFPK